MASKIDLAICAVTVVALLSGCGESGSSADVQDGSAASGREVAVTDVDWLIPAQEIEGIDQRLVGDGPDAAVILSASDSRRAKDVVIYLHGWQAVPPSFKPDDMRHLIDGGNTVVYPVYQDTTTEVKDVRGHALNGIEAALGELEFDSERVVAVGWTTGGALAFDYAAIAEDRGLPSPAAAIAIYPGRKPRGEIPPADLGKIRSDSWVVAASGPLNQLPKGDIEARKFLAAATGVPAKQRVLLNVSDGGARSDYASHGVYDRMWRSLDKVIKRARWERGRS